MITLFAISSVHADRPSPPATTTRAATLGAWGIETEGLAGQIEAGDDFFTYVNEGWISKAEMPPGFARFGAFTELALLAEERVEAIIRDAEASEEEDQVRIASLYRSYMDLDRIESLGLTPIRAELDQLLALETHEDIATWMSRNGTASIFSLFIGQDSGNPERYLVHIGQSGLGLPNRDYYLREDAPFPEHRAAYVHYIQATLERAGLDESQRRAEAIMALETALAEVHWSRVQQRDREANYRLIERAALEDIAPGFPWSDWLSARSVDAIDELVMRNDSAVQASAEWFRSVSVDDWRAWHAFHWLDNHGPYLGEAWRQAHFDFHDRRLGGVEEDRARDRRGIALVSSRLGELVGQVYVQRHFPASYKAQMETLVEYLRRAFRERLEALPWMDEETRSEALAKLAAFRPKIGYPDRWRDYSGIMMQGNDLIGNLDRLADWSWQDSLARLDEPVRDWEWFMSPQTVNAYYSSTRNEIVFPAAILQAPFFDPAADAAVNFGAIGGVIGHEMGHGFDDQGSRSDAAGVLRNWWSEQSRAQFDERSQRLADQYDAFEPLPGMNVNGRLSLGENIGDLGGLSIAHHAYRLYLEDHHDGQAPVLDGFTGDQRFFMAWSQVWRTIETEESLRARLIRGPHSPAQYRVNGVVRNIDAWYDAFGVTEEHALYLPPEARVSIW
ncbi:M13 family metallopeptidase [Wenzhouxiangella marina]|uniref:M13 family metallopeptidase n=1 Tax=Wenzhouxiangella marina TaxID=1579979 RepID=UPI0006737C58|nr:M13 family metallopeptidase [Wenzhouxiangella marina]MBB6086477.1 endothelin-converting enzyme/putative endopeptidase [Wenzhouxiangella marina]